MSAHHQVERAERYRRLARREQDGPKAALLFLLAAEAERRVLQATHRKNHIRVVHSTANVMAGSWMSWRNSRRLAADRWIQT